MRLGVAREDHGRRFVTVRVRVRVSAVSMIMTVVRMPVVVVVLVRVIVMKRVVVHEYSRTTHGDAGFACCADSMRPTAIAAPKPLSILTTVMPDAQLVNIPNSAVKPLRAVP